MRQACNCDLLAFSLTMFGSGSVECCEMWVVGVKKLADLLETKFLAKVMH